MFKRPCLRHLRGRPGSICCGLCLKNVLAPFRLLDIALYNAAGYPVARFADTIKAQRTGVHLFPEQAFDVVVSTELACTFAAVAAMLFRRNLRVPEAMARISGLGGVLEPIHFTRA